MRVKEKDGESKGKKRCTCSLTEKKNYVTLHLVSSRTQGEIKKNVSIHDNYVSACEANMYACIPG